MPKEEMPDKLPQHRSYMILDSKEVTLIKKLFEVVVVVKVVRGIKKCEQEGLIGTRNRVMSRRDRLWSRNSGCEEEVVPKVEDVSLVDGVFDGAFGGEGEEDIVMGEGLEEDA
ncbi:hypothetical protein Tco_1105444 [Tanacetum coccineum]